MNIYEKIQKVRIDLKAKNIKMTGRNKFADYDYFELDDFLEPLNELMRQYGMTAYPSFTAELATLTVVNTEQPEEKITITSPMGTANLKGCHEVQNIGAVETYQRRYLYQAMFDIAESDGLNKTQGKPDNADVTHKVESSTAEETPTKNKATEVIKIDPPEKDLPSDVLTMKGADTADNKTLFVNALNRGGIDLQKGRDLLDEMFDESKQVNDLTSEEFRDVLKALDKMVL